MINIYIYIYIYVYIHIYINLSLYIKFAIDLNFTNFIKNSENSCNKLFA